MKPVVIEVEGGCVVAVHGVDAYVIVDWDQVSEGWPKPELPKGYRYNEENDWVEEV